MLALGCALIGAAPPADGSGPKGAHAQVEQPIANAIDRLGSELERSNEPKREVVPCPEGTDDRQSDLCAQWKAADAAKQAASAAERSNIMGKIGLWFGAATTVAAIAAAFFAFRAAEQARRSADAAHADLRPWFSVEMSPTEFSSLDSTNLDVTLGVKIRNIGKSPGRLVGVRSSTSKPVLVPYKHGSKVSNPADLEQFARFERDVSDRSILPSESYNFLIDLSEKKLSDYYNSVKRGKITILAEVQVCASYLWRSQELFSYYAFQVVIKEKGKNLPPSHPVQGRVDVDWEAFETLTRHT